jgi:hypothetical protein
MNSTLFRYSISNRNKLMTIMARQTNSISAVKNVTKGNTLTVQRQYCHPSCTQLQYTTRLVSNVRCYHSCNTLWQQQQGQQPPKDDKIKDDTETSNNKDDASTTAQQPHGTATVTFVESDEAHSLPNVTDNDDDADDAANKKHPIESLKGGDPSAYTVPIVVKMPDMSDDDDDHNTIDKWYKQPGDIIKRNDILCDITTPAFTFGMVTEDEDDAIMGDIHVAEGDSASDNTPICTIYHLPDDHESKKKKQKKD